MKIGRPKKQTLKDQIPDNKDKAIRWIADLYEKFKPNQKDKRKGDRPPKRKIRELKKLLHEICKRFNQTPEEVRKKMEAYQKAKAKEDANQERMFNDPRCWTPYDL